MRVVLEVEEKFDAAHHLDFEEAGECMHTHGHTYHVVVGVTGEVRPREGWVMNLKALRKLLKNTLYPFDHRVINDHPAFHATMEPTAENLAVYIGGEMQEKLFELQKGDEPLYINAAYVKVQEGEGGRVIVEYGQG